MLAECLAYAVLSDWESWLGRPSPTGLSELLAGAEMRARLVQPELPRWRIHGPLVAPEAIELDEFSLVRAMQHLLEVVRSRGFDEARQVGEAGITEDVFWSRLLQRPATFTGSSRGEDLLDYLNGMQRGGDWLQLPRMKRLDAVLEQLQAASRESHGSDFGAFRAHGDVTRMLSRARFS